MGSLRRADLPPAGRADPAAGVWFARIVSPAGILPGILQAAEPSQLAADPALSLSLAPAADGGYDLTVVAGAYARAVELLLPPAAAADDNYFPLLPGESRIVHIRSSQRLDTKDITAACR